MKRTLIIGTLGVALLVSNGAWAATKKKLTVDETVWNMTGSYDVKYSFSCAVGGRGTGKKTITPVSQKNQQLTIAFNDDKTFEMSGDTLSAANLTGDWKISGRKITLIPDDKNASVIYLQSKYYQDYSKELNGSGSSGGASWKYKYSPPTYSFSGLIDTSGNTLDISEKSTFKVTASASVSGFSNTCTYQWTLSRAYSGKKAP
ncbi:lipocalin family protein [Methylomagnum sp.]